MISPPESARDGTWRAHREHPRGRGGSGARIAAIILNVVAILLGALLLVALILLFSNPEFQQQLQQQMQ